MKQLTEPNEDALDRIHDAFWNGYGDGVTLKHIEQHDPCNHTLYGSISVNDTLYGFVIDSGNWGGTVVQEWVLL